MEHTSTWVSEREETESVGVVAVVEGPDLGRERQFEDGEITVGKSDAANVRLSDPTVSRIHLSLCRDDARVRVRDLGSKNGTFVGATRIHDATVEAGTRLRLGATELLLAVRPSVVRRLVWSGGNQLGELIGGAPCMHDFFARLLRVAVADARVLLRGESGTGKELAARTIHRSSCRRDGPFVVVDAAAMADSLIEDELFGHVRGAFPGAIGDRHGAFVRAHGGTLFLDEIGDLPIALQAKLLRVLEDGTVQPLGGVERTNVDVRVIAATNKPLSRMVNERTFREDLYYRLAVLELYLPPLRERLADVSALARHILTEDGRGDPETVAAVDEALREHRGYAWPGNVRELRNFVRRVALLGPSHAELRPADVTAQVRADVSFHEAKDLWVEHFEREYVLRVLREAGGNVSEAARRSGLSRVHLSNLVQKHDLKRAM